jgi:hypothetical protein
MRLWDGWKAFARVTGEFQSRLLLGLFYFSVVAPFGILVRVFGDPLASRRRPRASNWTPMAGTGRIDIDTVRKQF